MDREDPRVFLLYERYTDAAAFQGDVRTFETIDP